MADSNPVAGILLTALIAYLVVSYLQNYARLRHIPGPFWSRFSDLWIIRTQLSGRMNLILHHVAAKYGPVAVIGPNWVVCSDAAELRKIWGVRSAWKRAFWYRGFRFDPHRDNAFSILDDDVHERLRAKLMPGYAGKGIANFEHLVDEQVARFVSLLESTYLSTKTSFKPVDMARKVQYFTLDVISSLAFGKAFGYLDADADLFDYIRTTESTLPVALTTSLMPWLLRVIQSPKLTWLMPSTRNMVGIGTVMGLAQDLVEARYGSDDAVARQDMLGTFIQHGLTKYEAEGETVVQIIAGSDTSATALRSTLMYIVSSPLVYHRLRAEIDAGVEEGRVSSPITDAEARQLPYLQAVIREGLRLYPPATAVLPKVSTEDQVVCGVRIPAGTNVAWAPWTFLRDTRTFGEDAEAFRPERWLDVSADEYRVMDQVVMMEFASGSRWECLGKTVAMFELNKTYVELLRRFDFALVNPTVPWKSFNAAVFIQSDMNVVVTKRQA